MMAGGRWQQLERVVVTGLGMVTPLGVGVQASWGGLLRADRTAGPLTDQRYAGLPSRVACRVPKEQPGGWEMLRPGDGQRMSEAMMFGLAAAKEALEDSGWDRREQEDRHRCGVAVGMGMVDLDYIGDCFDLVAGGKQKKVSPYFVPKILPNLAPGHISIKFGLEGPNHSCSTACATGSHAIGDAYRMIERGDADLMVAGGTEACISPLAMAGFSRAKALSTSFNGRPEAASRPFDRDRDGFVMGEGAGVLVLESLSRALARGANIYCEVLGCGLSGDADHITAAREDGRGAVAAMRGALRHLPASAVRHVWQVNAHATSTPRGDRAELNAVRRLFAGTGCRPYVTSNKGSIGHLLGAAGGVESAFSVLSIRHGVVPPSVNVENLDSDIVDDLEVVCNTPVTCDSQAGLPSDVPPRLVLKNSFGFGGTNVSLLFGQYIP